MRFPTIIVCLLLVGCGGGSIPTPVPVHNRLVLGYIIEGGPTPDSQQWFHDGSSINQETGVQYTMSGLIGNNGQYHVEFPGGASNDVLVEFYPSAAVAGVRITVNGEIVTFNFLP